MIIYYCNIETTNRSKDYSRYYSYYVYNSSKIFSPAIEKEFYRYIFITISNPINIYKRNIQRYYKKYYKNCSLSFYVIGNSNFMNLTYYENKIYNDVLSFKIKNNYFNITKIFLETISWIKTQITYDYIIKWDDDIIVNIPLFILYINLQRKTLHYTGYLYEKTTICRNKKIICYIPYHIYRYSLLPSFPASGLLILSRNTSQYISYYHKLYKSYMIRDDQYIGVLCNIISIAPSSINKYYIRKNSYNKSTLFNLMAYHTYNEHELYYIYKKYCIKFNIAYSHLSFTFYKSYLLHNILTAF